ncbi:MAG: substrate-binding domain-containing protein [Deltaproteobacteria bacterium]|jgi:molybdate/tungstate transport system substrate-binding protein|nr:substrate-binding domain-containing protein [Deltaproteobacteria bacterium]
MSQNLHVFTAGVAAEVTGLTIDRWNVRRPDCPARMTRGGSVEGVRRYLAGEGFDLLILADDALIPLLLGPGECSGYVVFAGNRMVLAASPDKPELTISSGDWLDKILDPGTRFFHFDPKADPGGYRAVLTMTLADRFEPGLTDKLLNHPGRLIQKPLKNPADKPDFDYFFLYYSMAKKRGLSMAELPEVMDLSQDSLASVYATARFEIDDRTTVVGTPIAHALTVPARAEHKEAAREFGEMFLENDFEAFNFPVRRKSFGTGLTFQPGGN